MKPSNANTMVRRFIAAVPPGEMFAARQVIHFGQSKPIYKLLSYMVNTGKLERMTWGVYLKPVRFGTTKYPTLEEIVAVKLRAFGREAITHECELAAEIDAYQISEADMAMRGFESGGEDQPLKCAHKQQVEHLKQVEENHKTEIEEDSCSIDDSAENDKAEPLSIERTITFDRVYDIDSSSSSIKTLKGVVKFRRVCKRKMSLGDTSVGRAVRGLWACGEDFISERRIYKALESLGRSGREELGNTSARGPNWLRDFLGCWQFIILNKKISVNLLAPV